MGMEIHLQKQKITETPDRIHLKYRIEMRIKTEIIVFMKNSRNSMLSAIIRGRAAKSKPFEAVN